MLQATQVPEMWVPTELIAMSQGVDCDGFSTFDVPIFTEEFLDQNKGEILAGAGVLVVGGVEMRMRAGVRTEVPGARDGGGGVRIRNGRRKGSGLGLRTEGG